MKKIRTGNDIHIVWTITKNGGTEALDLHSAEVLLIDAFKRPQNFTYTINRVDSATTQVVGTFFGKDQTTQGKYRLLLVKNRGLEEMITLDYADAFILTCVAKFGVIEGNDESSVTVATVDLQSEFDSYDGSPDMTNYYTKQEINELFGSTNFEIINCEARLNGDINGDAMISIFDQSLLNAKIMRDEGDLPTDVYDVNDDGNIGISDLSLVVNLILSKDMPVVKFENPYERIVKAFADGKIPVLKFSIGESHFTTIINSTVDKYVTKATTEYTSIVQFNADSNAFLQIKSTEEKTRGEIKKFTLSSDLTDYYKLPQKGIPTTDLEASAKTAIEKVPALEETIEENEYIVATALNDLDTRKLDASAYTPTDLSGYYTKQETSSKTEIATALDAITTGITDGEGDGALMSVCSLRTIECSGNNAISLGRGQAVRTVSSVAIGGVSRRYYVTGSGNTYNLKPTGTTISATGNYTYFGYGATAWTGTKLYNNSNQYIGKVATATMSTANTYSIDITLDKTGAEAPFDSANNTQVRVATTQVYSPVNSPSVAIGPDNSVGSYFDCVVGAYNATSSPNNYLFGTNNASSGARNVLLGEHNLTLNPERYTYSSSTFNTLLGYFNEVTGQGVTAIGIENTVNEPFVTSGSKIYPIQCIGDSNEIASHGVFLGQGIKSPRKSQYNRTLAVGIALQDKDTPLSHSIMGIANEVIDDNTVFALGTGYLDIAADTGATHNSMIVNYDKDTRTWNTIFDDKVTIGSIDDVESAIMTKVVTTGGTTTLSVEVNKYYVVTGQTTNLGITLPHISNNEVVQSIMVNLTTSTTPNITFTSQDSTPIRYYVSYDVHANTEYEFNIMYNGSKWIVTNAAITQ